MPAPVMGEFVLSYATSRAGVVFGQVVGAKVVTVFDRPVFRLGMLSRSKRIVRIRLEWYHV